jgi:hypothetical protein
MLWPFHPHWLVNSNIFCEEYKLWSPSCCFLQPRTISSLFSSNILPITLFPNTLRLCSSLNVRQSYKTTDKIIVWYILIFIFLDSRRKDTFLNEW